MPQMPADITITDSDGRLTPQFLHLLSQVVKDVNDLKVRVDKLAKRLDDARIP